MTIEEAKQIRLMRAGLCGESYPWLILPCRLSKLDNSIRIYVIVYNREDTELNPTNMKWADLFLRRYEEIPGRIHNRLFYTNRWSELISVCVDSDQWQAWYPDELFRYNCKNLVEDPTRVRGFIEIPEE